MGGLRPGSAVKPVGRIDDDGMQKHRSRLAGTIQPQCSGALLPPVPEPGLAPYARALPLPHTCPLPLLFRLAFMEQSVSDLPPLAPALGSLNSVDRLPPMTTSRRCHTAVPPSRICRCEGGDGVGN